MVLCICVVTYTPWVVWCLTCILDRRLATWSWSWQTGKINACKIMSDSVLTYLLFCWYFMANLTCNKSARNLTFLENGTFCRSYIQLLTIKWMSDIFCIVICSVNRTKYSQKKAHSKCEQEVIISLCMSWFMCTLYHAHICLSSVTRLVDRSWHVKFYNSISVYI